MYSAKSCFVFDLLLKSWNSRMEYCVKRCGLLFRDLFLDFFYFSFLLSVL